VTHAGNSPDKAGWSRTGALCKQDMMRRHGRHAPCTRPSACRRCSACSDKHQSPTPCQRGKDCRRGSGRCPASDRHPIACRWRSNTALVQHHTHCTWLQHKPTRLNPGTVQQNTMRARTRTHAHTHTHTHPHTHAQTRTHIHTCRSAACAQLSSQ
jgi:hypothetical protein